MNKVALITGVTSGMGKCMARGLLQMGYTVLGIGRDFEKLELCKKEFGKNFQGFECDVSDSKKITFISSTIKKLKLKPSLFILNAGTGSTETHGTLDIKMHQETFQTNYFGSMQWIQEWLPESMEEGATFVGISSLLAKHSTPKTAAYCASKSALSSAFESLRMEYLNTPLKFITVLPGPVDTKMFKSENSVPFVQAAEKASEIILKGVFKGKNIVAFPLFYNIFFNLLRLLPTRIVAKILK